MSEDAGKPIVMFFGLLLVVGGVCAVVNPEIWILGVIAAVFGTLLIGATVVVE